MDSEKYVIEHVELLPGNPRLIATQYHTRGGIIDVLAQYEDGSLAVIEVKSGIASIWAWCQLLRYCGALMEQLDILSSDKVVTGILIAKSLDKDAAFAFKALSKEQFRFIPLDELGEGGK